MNSEFKEAFSASIQRINDSLRVLDVTGEEPLVHAIRRCEIFSESVKILTAALEIIDVRDGLFGVVAHALTVAGAAVDRAQADIEDLLVISYEH